jgi:hydroxymethylpyrimidine/phosphomethylpyrimidine kinase
MDRAHGTVAMSAGPHVLVVAGTDSSGGAGLARDVETIVTFGLRASLAVTAVTVQTDQAVEAIEYMRPDLVAAQMRAAFDCSNVRAVKIGMLGMPGTVEAVARVLADHRSVPVVFDPVLAASSGRALAYPHAIEALKISLLPQCCIVTPNIPELAILTGMQLAHGEDEALMQGELLLDAGVSAVLVKGGHAYGDRCVDFLLRPELGPVPFDAPRLPVTMRGTGCMLASAIAANLALGEALEDCALEAKRYVHDRLQNRKIR